MSWAPLPGRFGHRVNALSIDVAIVGGGPAGLMAAEAAVRRGAKVALFDQSPSVGRKFLLAGKGGLNLTHAEPLTQFLARYSTTDLVPFVNRFSPAKLREWAHDLGVPTVVGTSRRVFPHDYKAAPLLRRWVARLRAQGVTFYLRHRWLGFGEHSTEILLDAPSGAVRVSTKALVLALGGASWPRLGSDGCWAEVLEKAGLPLNRLQPSNCGFESPWTPYFRERFAGAPLKPLAAWSELSPRRGECVVTTYGLEGGVIYALSPEVRRALERGHARVWFDLTPDLPLDRLVRLLETRRPKKSLATELKRLANLSPVKIALLHEVAPRAAFDEPNRLAGLIKALPIPLTATRPLADAISTAGGVRFDGLDARLMSHARPGVFFAGEMLDWEAPTGGYLLTACFATGSAAGSAAGDFACAR